MAEARKSQPTAIREDTTGQPYSPSWVDHLTAWVDRLPGPAWLFYAAAGLLLLLLISALKWRDSVIPVGEFTLFYVSQTLVIPYMLALLHYLDRMAADALDSFRPVLLGDNQQYANLHHRLTTLSPVPALLAAALGIAYGQLPFNHWTPDQIRALKLDSSPLATNVEWVLSILGWAVAGTFIYHSIHQLRVVNTIYTRFTRIDLSRLGRLYAFSGVAAVTAIAVTGGFVLYITPAVSATEINFSTTVNAALFGLVGAIAFFAPLTGAHRPLVKERQRLLDENAELLQETVGEIHRRARAGQLEDMDQLKAAQDSLITEHERLSKTSTWPWRSGILGAVGTALLLPLLITILDQILRRLLGL